jgi:pentatricopeptide repeat protein
VPGPDGAGGVTAVAVAGVRVVEQLSASTPAGTAAGTDHYAEALLRFRGDVRMMEQVLATMIERRVPRSDVHLGLMLDQYLEGRELRKARAVIAQLEEAGIALDGRRLYAVALATAAAGQAAEAVALVERLSGEGHEPSTDQVPGVLALLAGSRRLATVWPLYRRTAARRPAVDRDVHLALLADALTRRAAKDTMLVLRAMLAAGQVVPATRGGEAIRMLVRSGQVDRAVELYGLLAAAPDAVAPTPDGEVVAALLATLARRGRVDDVVAIASAAAGGEATDPHLRNVVLGARLAAGDRDAAWAEVEAMWAAGLLPTGANLELLLDLELAAGGTVRAAGILDWLVVIGAPVSTARSGPVLRAELAADLRGGLALAGALLDGGQVVDRAAARDLVERLVRARRLDDARRWLERFRAAGTLTLGRSWGSLLAALVAAKRSEEAIALLEELVAAGIAPEPADVARLVAGQLRAADRLGAARIAAAASAAGVHLAEDVLRELLWSHARAGDAPAAEQVITLIVAAGITPDERYEKALAWANGSTRRRLDEPPAADALAPEAPDAPDAPATPEVPATSATSAASAVSAVEG